MDANPLSAEMNQQPGTGTAVNDALRQSEARKDAILKAALDAIITMDHEGDFVEFNPAAERIFG